MVSVDEEYPMEMDDEEDFEEPSQPIDSDILNLYVIKISEYVDIMRLNPTALRHTLFEYNLRTLAEAQGLTFEDIILASNAEDTGYNGLISALYPALAKHLSQAINEKHRSTLANLLGSSISATIWEGIEKKAKAKQLSPEKLAELATRSKVEPLFPLSTGLLVPEFVETIVTDRATSNKSDLKVINDNLELLKAIEEPPAKEEELVEDAEGVDPMEVKSIVNDIMNVYDKLYAPGFVNRPLGVLTSDGVMTIDSSGKPKLVNTGTTYAKRIYGSLVSFTSDYLPTTSSKKIIDSSFLTDSGELKEVYSPMYHLNNIYGVRSDGTVETRWMDFRGYLAKDIYQKVSSVLGKVTGDTLHVQMALKELFTNCIIIDTLDRVMALQMRVRLDNLGQNYGRYLLSNSKALFATDTGLLINEEEDNVKVRNILYVFDENAYKNEILFSYKAQEKLIASGVKPSAQNVVIGRGLNGKDVTENFADAGNVVTGIIAGSRSGKGVVTLNILASLYADNCPVFYVDYKPDMAATLWDMERYFQSKGINAPIFAIDGLADKRADGGDHIVKPVRKFPYGLNAPQGLGLETADNAIMPYLKSMQLSALLAQLRMSGDLPKKDKMFFVFDEAQKANNRYALVLGKLTKLETKHKPKKGEEPSAEYDYITKYITVFQHDLKDGIGAVMNTTGGAGQVGLIVLGQKVDPAEWKLGELGDWRKGVFGNLIANMNIKLIGRESGNSKMYGIPKIKYSGSEFSDQRGYFLKYRGSTAPDDPNLVEMIKTYLVLNKNDFDKDAYNSGNIDKSTFTGSLITNINDSTARNNIVMNDLLNEDTSIRESIGFGGLMKMIMGESNDAELASRMSQSYNILTQVFNKMGLNQRYSCVEEYLYDCSYESIFSISEMLDMYHGISAGSSDEQEDAEDGPDWFNQPNQSNQTNTENPFTSTDNKTTPNPDSPFNDEELENEYVSADNDDTEQPFDTDNDEIPLFDEINDEEHQPFKPTKPVTPEQSAEEDKYVPPNQRSGYDNTYNAPLTLPQNPFTVHGRSGSPISAINSIRMFSNYIMADIQRFAGDLSRIESFEVTGTGLVINNIAFRPTFTQDVIDSMPFDIKQQVQQGNIVELFHFENLKKFRNLTVLRIDNSRLAEGRVRREIGLHPNKTWFKLFDKFRNLRELYIGGKRIVDEPTSQQYDNDGRGGFDLTEKLRGVFGMGASVISNSRMERVWESRPVKVVSRAAGWTVGIKVVSMAAMAFGPWGMIFAGLAGYGALKGAQNRRDK